jgi:hypothetical protein
MPGFTDAQIIEFRPRAHARAISREETGMGQGADSKQEQAAVGQLSPQVMSESRVIALLLEARESQAAMTVTLAQVAKTVETHTEKLDQLTAFKNKLEAVAVCEKIEELTAFKNKLEAVAVCEKIEELTAFKNKLEAVTVCEKIEEIAAFKNKLEAVAVCEKIEEFDALKNKLIGAAVLEKLEELTALKNRLIGAAVLGGVMFSTLLFIAKLVFDRLPP